MFLVSLDFMSQKDKVLQFLSDLKVPFPTYIKNEQDQSFIRSLGEDWKGVLPANFVFDAQNKRIAFWQGESSYTSSLHRIQNSLKGEPQ